jgi:diguanylate cyclase (GGDEF)-like protein
MLELAQGDDEIGVLVIDDDEDDREYLRRLLGRAGRPVAICEAPDLVRAREVLASRSVDCVIVDYRLGALTGLELWGELQAALPPFCPAIMVTGLGDEEVAAAALRAGVSDYLIKGHLDGGRLSQSLEHAVRHSRLERRLHNLAFYDALTGLASRSLFSDRLQQVIDASDRGAGHPALAYIDLDKFKAINDRHGHPAGDQVLVEVARRLRAAIRPQDTAARLGGDEFAVILAGVPSPADCHQIVTRLADRLAAPIALEAGGEVSVTASIGVVVVEDRDTTADTVVRHADHMMYEVKRAGRRGIQFFDPTVEAGVNSVRRELEGVARALERDELVLAYQPKVKLESGELVGLEALLRWRHPERGLLTPEKFWTALQHRQLCSRIGDWVLRTAVAQLAAWRLLGLRTSVSVNVAAHHFLAPEFPEHLEALLKSYPELPAHALELELLETEGLEDLPRAVEVMTRCKALGVTIAIDDFGTGHSSLAYLRSLPLDVLKIDRSFVINMFANHNDQAIVRGIIGMCTAFGHHVVAEGVETEAHARKLVEFGCAVGQGFGIARPMPAGELWQWWATRRGIATA